MDTGSTIPVIYGEVVRQLHELGWRPLPLKPDTKQPADIGWPRLNQAPLPANELGLMERQFHGCACGIAIPNSLLAVDIDVLDEAVSAEIQDISTHIFGKTPLIRIGMAPKCLLIFRSDGTTTSRKPHPVEIFSGSGQIAAFGIHAKTQQPYWWPEQSLLDLRSDSPEIPLVTGTQQRQFLAAINHITAPRKSSRRTAPIAGRASLEANDPGAMMTALLRKGLRFNRAAERILSLADVGQRHSCVRAVVSAGFNAGMTADSIETIINRHASPEVQLAVANDGYLERLLRDFAPQKVQRGTV